MVTPLGKYQFEGKEYAWMEEEEDTKEHLTQLKGYSRHFFKPQFPFARKNDPCSICKRSLENSIHALISASRISK